MADRLDEVVEGKEEREEREEKNALLSPSSSSTYVADNTSEISTVTDDDIYRKLETEVLHKYQPMKVSFIFSSFVISSPSLPTRVIIYL